VINDDTIVNSTALMNVCENQVRISYGVTISYNIYSVFLDDAI
jgi:hypothetical protein